MKTQYISGNFKNENFLKTVITKVSSFFIILLISSFAFSQSNERPVLGYFPSWSESYAATDQNSKLREVPEFVNHIFLAFAKPNLRYTSGSYDISETGIQVPYDGCALKESVSALKDKGIKVILSVGGETYWNSPSAYEIEYDQIKDLVDDIGFSGIDWDYEPNGSFANIGDPENVQHFIDFFNNSREIMPREEGYILACAPSGVGAIGGIQNNDPESPYAFANRNELTGENDDNLYNAEAVTNGINLFGFSATGHMIPVIQSVGDKIDLIAFQGYNVGGSNNRSIMFDAYEYYANQYGFKIAAGVHYPPEPWGPYYEYTHETVASLSSHIIEMPSDNYHGLMIWQILLTGANSSAYSYMNVGSLIFAGETEVYAIENANNYSLSPYEGGAEGCDSLPNVYCGVASYNPEATYSSPDIQVYYSCKIWHNQWWANPGEIPGENEVWVMDTICNEGPECGGNAVNEDYANNSVRLYPNPANDFIKIRGIRKSMNYFIYDIAGRIIQAGRASDEENIEVSNLIQGTYVLNIDKKYNLIFSIE